MSPFGGGSNAPLDVIFEDQQGDRIHCRPQGRGLLEDVDAVLAPLDHPLDAAHLAFDTAEPADEDRLVARVRVPEGRIELRGVCALLGRDFRGRSRANGQIGGRPRPLSGLGGARFARVVLQCHSNSLHTACASPESSVRLRAAVVVDPGSMIPPGSIGGNPSFGTRGPRRHRVERRPPRPWAGQADRLGGVDPGKRLHASESG